MQIFLFIDGHNQHGIFRVEELLCQLQPPLHKRKPFTVTVAVGTVHIVVVVFPVLRTGVVGRIDIDAVHFAYIEILQKLQGMVVVRLNECMPKVTVGRILHTVNGREAGENRLTELGNGYKLILRNLLCFAGNLAAADSRIAIYLDDRIGLTDFIRLFGNRSTALYGHTVQRRTFGHVFLKHKPEFFILCQTVDLLTQSRTKRRICNLF